MGKTEQYLIDKADQCIRLARAGRELADNLEAMSNDLMAKAVELDTARQRHEEQQVIDRDVTDRKAIGS